MSDTTGIKLKNNQRTEDPNTNLDSSFSNDIDLSSNPFLEYEIEDLFQIPLMVSHDADNNDALSLEDIQNLPSPATDGAAEAEGSDTLSISDIQNLPSPGAGNQTSSGEAAGAINNTGINGAISIGLELSTLPTIDSVIRDVAILQPASTEGPNLFTQPIDDGQDGLPQPSTNTTDDEEEEEEEEGEACESIVTTFADGVNANDNETTLRETILEANQSEGVTEIHLCEGIYQLDIMGRNENLGFSGDLDIHGQVVIEGHDKETTIIDAGAIDRVLQVMPNASLTLKNLTLQNGDAKVFSGGAIYNLGTVVLDNVIIDSNQARIAGGIFNAFEANMVIDNSTISNNQAVFYAGGILNDASTLDINYSTIQDNQAGNYGSGLTNIYGEVNIFKSLIAENSANLLGAGIATFNGDMDIQTSTISSNQASFLGGGIASFYGQSFDLSNSTLTQNFAQLAGAGVYQVQPNIAQTFDIYSSIIAQNNSNLDIFGAAFQSNGHNIIGNVDDGAIAASSQDQFGSAQGTSATGHTGVINALLDVLADNGGFTSTHALLTNSSAIDNGNVEDDTSDQRDLFPSHTKDIGAFESNGQITPSANLAVIDFDSLNLPILSEAALLGIEESFEFSTVSAPDDFMQAVLKIEEILLDLTSLEDSVTELNRPNFSASTIEYHAENPMDLSELNSILLTLPEIMQDLHASEMLTQPDII